MQICSILSHSVKPWIIKNTNNLRIFLLSNNSLLIRSTMWHLSLTYSLHPHPPWVYFWHLCLIPAMTRSTAYSKLNVWTDVCPSRAACRAASLQMFAMSAPVSKIGNGGGIGSTPSGMERRKGKENCANKCKGVKGQGMIRAVSQCSRSIRPKEPPLHILFQSFYLLHCFTTQLLSVYFHVPSGVLFYLIIHMCTDG